MPDGNKGKEKRKEEEKMAKSLKKQRNRLAEKKVSLPKYTNYHAFTALVDHMYTVTDRSLYRQPEAMTSDRSRRDIK